MTTTSESVQLAADAALMFVAAANEAGLEAGLDGMTRVYAGALTEAETDAGRLAGERAQAAGLRAASTEMAVVQGATRDAVILLVSQTERLVGGSAYFAAQLLNAWTRATGRDASEIVTEILDGMD